eukprot:6172701-Pleurochrysis_carterae.AAC.1
MPCLMILTIDTSCAWQHWTNHHILHPLATTTHQPSAAAAAAQRARICYVWNKAKSDAQADSTMIRIDIEIISPQKLGQVNTGYRSIQHAQSQIRNCED